MTTLPRFDTALPKYVAMRLMYPCPAYVGRVNIHLIPALRVKFGFDPVKIRLHLWTSQMPMLDYLAGNEFDETHMISKEIIDTSKSINKIYNMLKFSPNNIHGDTEYGYYFKSPLVLPEYDNPIVGWSVREGYVEEL